jgi:ubiquinone/menaquinone biosynthesis C-methylase UbiE
MINKRLNYGRQIIHGFVKESRPFESVLDIGAGNGIDLDNAKAVNSNAKLYAVETYEPKINHLRTKNVQIFPIDVEKDKLPFEDKSIDIIIANQILEHTKEIFWIMHEISRVLKVGGNMILGVPNLASLHNRLLLLFGRHPTPIQLNSAHIRGFTKEGVINFFNVYGGYRLLDFKGANFYPFPPFLANHLANLFPSLAWGIFFLMEKTKEYSSEFLDYPVNEKLETSFYTGE